jgi:hypothetical protein
MEVAENVRYFGLGIFPPGCKFLTEDGDLSLGGKILATALIEKLFSEGQKISPCEGCFHYPECEKEGLNQERIDLTLRT